MHRKSKLWRLRLGKAAPLLLLFTLCSAVAAAQVVVKGIVIDSKGAAIPGVSVTVTGKSTGTSTNDEGVYSITAAKGDRLQFSAVGYISQEAVIANNPEINITLAAASTQAMDEVVVIGYGTMRKKDLTGAVVQIKPDNLANENPNTVQDILGHAGFAGRL